MALDPIWKQQLALVSYGNEYLNQNLSFNDWVNHAIFNQHVLAFRDLNNQHLLAQHFQIWLESLKKQGVSKISLHNSSLLIDEKNPNPNVELLPYAHFIVSHHAKSQVAWIFGKELAEWYIADTDFDLPHNQKPEVRFETLWRFELNSTHAKRVAADLQQPNWDDIHAFTEHALFDQPLAQGFTAPNLLDQSYYGYEKDKISDHFTSSQQLNLALLPSDYHAAYAHDTLIRLEALRDYVSKKIQHPIQADGQTLEADEVLSLRHFQQKLEDLTAKFVTKVANHYKTARLTPTEVSSPLDEPATYKTEKRFFKNEILTPKSEHKSGKSNVFALIIITVVICICGYYFGL